MSNLEIGVVEHPLPIPQVEVPACQRCGRQDETLRLVSYPFVFSILVMTFRRTLTGLWCDRHRTQSQAIAGLISAIFGWLGFPFGIIFTPLTLFQLAKGGEQPADANIQFLTALAEDKLKKGDKNGAIKCLEECLKFRDDPEIQQRLKQLRTIYGTQVESAGCFQIGLRLLGALFVCLLIGIPVGILDYANGYIQFLLFGDGEVNIFIGILSYSPLLIAIYFAGLGLATLIERTLLRIQTSSLMFTIPFAILTASVNLYGIFEGNTIADNIYSVLNNLFESVEQIIVVGLITLVAGGFFAMAGMLQFLGTNILHLVILLLAFGFFITIGVWKARETVLWQQRKSITHSIQ